MAFCGMQPFGHCPAVERQSRFAFWKNNVYRKRTIFDECEFYSSSCHFASCRGYALTCVAVQGSGSIRGSHVEPKQSPVTLGAPLGWLGIRRSHITDLQHHQEVVSPKGSGGPSEPWRRIDSCYQFNSICIYIYMYIQGKDLQVMVSQMLDYPITQPPSGSTNVQGVMTGGMVQMPLFCYHIEYH